MTGSGGLGMVMFARALFGSDSGRVASPYTIRAWAERALRGRWWFVGALAVLFVGVIRHGHVIGIAVALGAAGEEAVVV